MESLERPAARSVDVPAIGTRRATGKLAWLRRAPLRLMLAATIVVVSLGLGAVAIVAPRAAYHVTETADGPLVVSVGVGSYAWIDGVRPDAVGSWLQGAADPHEIVYFQFPNKVGGVPLTNEAASTQNLILALASVLLGAALVLVRLPGSPALLALGSGVALVPLELQAGLPAALPLLALPPLVALLTVRLAGRSRQLLFDVGSILLIGALLAAGVALTNGTIDTPWPYTWYAPTVLGIFIAVSGGLIAFVVRYRALPESMPGRLIAAAVPLASHSRLEGADEERSRLALELHNTVLPRVQTSLESLRHETSVEAAANELETIATDLRGAMARRQTVTLEMGGVAAALRSEFEGLPGPRVEFFVRGGSNRPPRRVELAAYRVGQAAIDNALRHSGAERVSVAITSGPDVFELTITDDGVGLDALAEHAARRRGHIGIAQMRLRAESVGAALELQSAPDEGTTVRFHWAA